MRILAVESSCDDTSVALMEGRGTQVRVLKETARSQIDIHALYGGVVPEVAARAHAEVMVPLLAHIFSKRNPPDVIAVTVGPGLVTSLVVGIEAVRVLSALTGIPLIAVNHIEGHVYSNWIQEKARRGTPIKFPALCLVVSGGHTELILMKDHLRYKKIGATRDDAAGEAFDKVAKLLGLEYPGGPKIAARAARGRRDAVRLPRPMLTHHSYEFSFAGLKTAALYYIQDNPALTKPKSKKLRADFCASFEQAIVDVLVTKTIRAAQQYSVKSVLLSGGVAGNVHLRESLDNTIKKNLSNVTYHVPPIKYCMDNAAMIGAAGYFKARAKKFTRWEKIQADPQWEIK